MEPSQRRPARLTRKGLAVFLAVASRFLCGCNSAPSPESRASAVIIVDDCSGVADLALCNDKNTCTTDDRCKGGLCVGTPAADGTACTDGNQCTRADLCNQGVCAGSPVPEGTACTDGDPCTADDSCRSGLCMPGAATVCDDGLACTVDTCAPGIGCQFQAIPSCPVADGGTPQDAQEDAQPDANVSTVDVGPAPDAVAEQDAGAPGDDGPTDAAGTDLLDGPMDGDDSGDLTVSVDGADESTLPDGGDMGDVPPQDGSQDGSATDGSSPVFKARGGACSCELAARPGTGTAVGTVWLIALCFFRRRRSRAASSPQGASEGPRRAPRICT